MAFFASLAFCQQESRYFQNITVEAGDTIWSISQRYLKDPRRWPEILKYNNLPGSDPTVTLAGQTLKIPVLLIKEELRAAKVIEAVNNTQCRRKESVDWTSLKKSQELYQEDGVRTGELSRAAIRFAVGEDLVLESNSFAVIRPERLAKDFGRGVSLVGGSVQSRGVRVLTQTARVTPKTKETAYRARIREDLATVVEVFKGAADVEGKGAVVLVRQGFGTEVPVGQAPSAPMVLPPMPQAIASAPSGSGPAPADADATKTGEAPYAAMLAKGEIKFPQTSAPGPRGSGYAADEAELKISYYKIQIARQPDAASVVWESSLPVYKTFALKETGIKDGVYYLRLALRDRLGLEGSFGEWKKIEIDSQPPSIEIFYPHAGVRLVKNNPMEITGKTEKNAFVSINEKEFRAGPDGNFNIPLYLKTGKNTLKIVSSDLSGNNAEQSFDVFYETSEYGPLADAYAAQDKSRSLVKAGEDKKSAAGVEKIAQSGVGAVAAVIIIGIVVLLIL